METETLKFGASERVDSDLKIVGGSSLAKTETSHVLTNNDKQDPTWIVGMDPVVASVRSLKLRPRHHGGCAWRYAAGWTTLSHGWNRQADSRF